MDLQEALRHAVQMLDEHLVYVAGDREACRGRGDRAWADRLDERWELVGEVRNALQTIKANAVPAGGRDLARIRAIAADLVHELGFLEPDRVSRANLTLPVGTITNVTALHNKLVAYMRVSTDRQADEGFGLEIQEQAIKAWARRNGYRITHWIRDAGESGSSIDRPGLAEAFGRIQNGEAHGIVVARLDRIARDLVLQEWIRADLIKLDAELRSTSMHEDAFLRDDPEDPSGKLIRRILGAVAEYEREIIQLRMAAGRARKRAAGGHAVGRPPYGSRAGDHELEDDPVEQLVIARMVALRKAGQSFRQIAEHLNDKEIPSQSGGLWHPITVARVVNRRMPKAG